METVEEQFVKWENVNQEDINHVFDLLSDNLSDQPEELVKDLQAIEAWNARVQYLLAESNSWLDRLMSQKKAQIEPGTAFDRKIELDAMVAPIRAVRDKIEGLTDSIKQRLILGESILAFHRAYHERVGKEKERIY